MNCRFCGIAVPDGMEYCPNCGRETAEPIVEEIPVEPPVVLSRKEFLYTEENSKIRKNIKLCAILGYVIAGINLIGYIVMGNFIAAIITALVFTILSLLIHLRQSLVASIIFLVLGIISTALSIIMLGSFSGGFIIAIGIDAVIWTSKFHKAWKAYSSTNQ